MKDPRLKPVVIPKPTRPFCTYASFLPIPLTGFISGIFLHGQEAAMRAAAAAKHVKILIYCGMPDPIGELMAFRLSLCVLGGSVLGLLLIWWGNWRCESLPQARTIACIFNALAMLLMIYCLFSHLEQMANRFP